MTSLSRRLTSIRDKLSQREVVIPLAALGFLIIFIFVIGGGFLSLESLRTVIQTKDAVVRDLTQDFATMAVLETASEAKVAHAQGYLLTHDKSFLLEMRHERTRILNSIASLQRNLVDPRQVALLIEISGLEKRFQDAYDDLVARFGRISEEEINRRIRTDLIPKRQQISRQVSRLFEIEIDLFNAEHQVSDYKTNSAIRTLVVLWGISLLLTTLVSGLIFKILTVLRRGEKRLQLAVRAREDVLAVVSHDLKNPISSVKLNAELLSKAATPDSAGDTVRRQAQLIRRSAETMLRLIRDILDYAKVESGALQIDSSPHSVSSIFSETEELFRALASRKGLRLDWKLQKGEVVAFCDRDRVIQVLSNLVGNAVKFTPPGGKITLNGIMTEGQALISVADTGPGIAKENLTRIFDRYWQPRETAKTGTGLGLAIAKGIVTAHGGTIWAESAPGNGSTFLFTLPLAEAGGVRRSAA